MIYKTSYVVLGGEFPGAIKTETTRPEPGKRVKLGRTSFEVIEVQEISPARDDFQFLHVTVKPVSKTKSASTNGDGDK